MATFKVVFGEEERTVVVKGDFVKYQNFNDLRKSIIDSSSQKTSFKAHGKQLKEKDNFVLEISGDLKGKFGQLDSVYNKKTYNYFLDKMKSFPEQNKVKFIIKKVDKLPVFKPPQFSEALNLSLTENYEELKNSVIEKLDENNLNQSKQEFERRQLETDPERKELFFKRKNVNVICENCFSSNFYGIRYICAECNNYNLCEICKESVLASQLHDINHSFIQIKTPINESINNYSSIFNPKCLFFNDKENSFKVEFSIANNGENNLVGCFILPIRFGPKYLGCFKKTITESFDKNEKMKVEILVKYPDENPFGTYKGYFRMFTEGGLPFGDILVITSTKDH